MFVIVQYVAIQPNHYNVHLKRFFLIVTDASKYELLFSFVLNVKMNRLLKDHKLLKAFPINLNSHEKQKI